MNNSRTKKLLITAASLTLVSFLLAALVFYLIFEKRASVETLDEQLQLAQAQQDTGVNINHLLNDTKSERSKIDSYFVGSDNVVSFIEQIESLSTLAKVDTSINTVGVEKASTGNSFEYVTLNGTAEGSFSNVFWLLSLIETLPLQVDVSQVYFDRLPGEPKAKSFTWRLTFTVRALKLK